MTVYLSIDGITTSCGRPLGELAEDSYTTDPDLAGCLECESLLGRPQDAAAVAVAYGQGYADGKEKAYFELEQWQPQDHLPTCGCQPCLVARALVRKVLGPDPGE